MTHSYMNCVGNRHMKECTIVVDAVGVQSTVGLEVVVGR